MTRRDYEAIAAAFKARLESGSAPWTVRDLAHDVAQVFAADNARFDKVRFLAACGLDDYAEIERVVLASRSMWLDSIGGHK